ncbi:MucBP domain-containing protein, partial [Paucilactobacillus sp. N302-9]
MAYKKLRKLAKDSSVEKKRFKLYKSGRNWMVAGLATVTFGLAQLGFSQIQSVHADTTDDEVSATSAAGANTNIQEKTVALSTAAASGQPSVVQNGNDSGSGSGSSSVAHSSFAAQSSASADPSATNSSVAAQSSTSADSSTANSSATAQSSDSTGSTAPVSSVTPQVKTFVDATFQAAAADPAGTTTTLPAGFSVSDPDYPSGTYHYSEDSNWYTFAQMNSVTFAIDRTDLKTIQIGIVGADGTLSQVQNLPTDGSSLTYGGLVIHNDEDSIYVNSPSSMSYIFDVLQYPEGTSGYSGFSFFKPLKQTQKTEYLDQNGKEIADSVTMTGLSGQKYSTSASDQLSGYTPTDSGNTDGTMSPWMENGQQRKQVVYNADGTKKGTITYTVVDVNKGTIDWVASDAVSDKGELTYDSKTGTKSSGKAFGNYTVKNPYIPQTTNITYTYNAQDVTIKVKYVDENGVEIQPQQEISSLYNEETDIPEPSITGYTYDSSYLATKTDNPASYTVSDLTADNIVTLHYLANDENINIQHVDEAGNVIVNKDGTSTDTVISEKYNSIIDLAKTDKNYEVYDYEIDPQSPKTYTVVDGENDVILKYIQQQDVTVNYVDQNGNAIDATLLTNAPQTLKGIIGENIAVTSPAIAGYSAYKNNPTNYTVVDGTNSITLKYVQTKMTVSVTTSGDGDSFTYVIVDGNGNPITSGNSVDTNDANSPKWPSGLTADQIASPNPNKSTMNDNDLDRVISETVQAYTVTASGTQLTSPANSYYEVYFTRPATIDFSDPDNPTVTYGDWTAVKGKLTSEDSIQMGLTPGLDYTSAYVPKVQDSSKGQTVVAYDGNGKEIQLSNMSVAGDSYKVIPAVQMTPDSKDLTYYVITFKTDVVSKNFTRTIHYETADGTTLKEDTTQNVTVSKQSQLDVTTPASPKLVLTDWSGNPDAFAAVEAPVIEGYTATNNASEATVDGDTTATNTEVTIVYTPNSTTADVVINTNDGPKTVTTVTGTTGQTIQVTVPVKPGYTAAPTTVPATVNPDGTITTTEKVTYTPETHDYSITPVDA